MIELRLTQYNSTRTAACWSLILAPTACTDGGSCRPRLNIAKASGNRVALDWSTAALGYQLERTNVLSNPPHPLWVPVPEVPVITAGRFRVTNNIALPPRTTSINCANNRSRASGCAQIFLRQAAK